MSYGLYLLLKSEFRNIFPRFYSWISFLSTSAVILFGYYCTSKALTPVNTIEGWHQSNYFDFIVFGEIIIALPLAALLSPSVAIKTLSGQGILENIIYNGKSPFKSLFLVSLSLLFKDSAFIITHLLTAYLVFSFNIDVMIVLKSLIFVIASIPVFLLLGILFGHIVMSTGRGAGIISNVSYLIMLLSGVFFPVGALPEFFKVSTLILPQSFLLDFLRRFAADGNVNIADYFIYFVSWALFLFIINKALIPFSIKRYPLVKEYLDNAR